MCLLLVVGNLLLIPIVVMAHPPIGRLAHDPGATLAAVVERDPVRVGAEADLPDVAVLMTDYNLLDLPVVDEDDRLLGVITVDDALEATLPDAWRRREPGTHRSARYAAGPRTS